MSSVVRFVFKFFPAPLRALIVKHREMLRFAVVGGTTFVITNVVWYGLKLTVLDTKPITAQAIAIVVATIVSYVLSREWSFQTRGGREGHHEAALFFLVSAIGVGLNLMPTLVSRYVFGLQVPAVSMPVQELSDFFFGSIIGTLIAMVFRWWAFKKWVFPAADVRPERSGSVAHLRAVPSEGDGQSEQVA
ncbi:putative flippase GtrA [Kutzneria kofuensis]|uniref:Putative flippase GtrA n=2 Tax=Kutzneria kofuensis TaxID=103725 RepID=A0A7W9KJ55_9PSEU|nr:putative flippase GtrA [Kutzneria kofuensis]